ncbi:MAG: alpha/beta hydrolase [Chloroflexi bacterium]|nr:alpha/beta hydrolase [Chloroflexota bacterium]
MFESFKRVQINVGDVTINAVVGGNGRPLLLLHGYPQTHAIWHKVAPRLAQSFSVVAADLRGYGDSGKPEGALDHSNYSKRVMARDQVELMRQLGFEQFFLAGHDRGARVAHRLAVDHPERVWKLATLDISPTKKMYESTNQEFARAYYHWFFFIQPKPLPEKLIGGDARFYMLKKIGSGSAGLAPFTPEALNEYLRCFTPETIHGSCEDYRASASIDLEYDRTDIAAGRKVVCPMLALWGKHGVIEKCFSPVDDWREVANDVCGHALPGGHYLAEEVPELVAVEWEEFFL